VGLINDQQALNIFDSLACEQFFLQQTIDALVSGLTWYQRVHEPIDDILGDPDVEKDLVTSAVALDRNYRSGTTLTGFYSTWVRAISRHLQNQGFSNIDDWLSTRDLNLHEYYNPLHASVFGTGLNAVNVFKSTECVLGTTDFTGSGVCVFTDGLALGTGSDKFSSTNSAAADVKLVVTNPGGTGANDILIKVVGTDESSNQVISSTATIPNGSAQDTAVSVTTTNPLLDVTAVQCAGGSNNDQFEIRNVLDRNLTECSGISTFLKSTI